MLDRLISGAGAVADGADRSVRVLASGSRGGFATTRPGSLVVAAVLGILAALLVLAGLEATDPPTPVPLAAADVAGARDLGNRTYSTLHGSLAASYVAFFVDENGNGIEDAGENADTWYYWLVDPTTRTGVTVRSARPPEAVFTFRGSGVLIDEPRYTREAYQPYADEATQAGLKIESAVVVDTTTDLAGTRTPVDLTGPLPPSGTRVEISGSRLGQYVGVCSHDADRDGECGPDEEDLYEVAVFDPISRRAIHVLVRDLPEFTAEASITGQLRREERDVDAARTSVGSDFGALDVNVSDRYILDDAAAPGSAPLAFGLAAALAAVVAVILVGLAGGYIVYRRSDARLPSAATTLAPGERIPLRITGVVRTPTGFEHVREAPGELVRFVLGHRVPTTVEPVAPAADEGPSVGEPVEVPAGLSEAGSEEAAIDPADAGPVDSTLLVERVGHPQGVALGSGETTRLSSGLVITFRTPRPAVRVVAATGALLLSFDSETERDRAAAELLDETGLGPDGKPIRID